MEAPAALPDGPMNGTSPPGASSNSASSNSASSPGSERAAPRAKANWLSRLRPGLKKKASPRAQETPDNLWLKDPDTGEMLYRPDLEAALWVTPSGHHVRLTPEQRFSVTFDEGLHERIKPPAARQDDPLNFRDQKPYPERLKAARTVTGEVDAMSIAFGRIHGQAAVVLVQNFGFLGGSLGQAAGEGFIAAAREAIKRDCPLVVFTASGGARMQEGALSLMQMARATLAIQELKARNLPYLVVLTDPTTGGVTASYAMLGDVQFAEPGALIAFTGPRVIEQTIRETLPPGFQRAEYLEDKGVVDQVTPRAVLRERLGAVIAILMDGRARLRAA
jgi:acetyl-CoA carboxylase carboxyl transferase subunit beta